MRRRSASGSCRSPLEREWLLITLAVWLAVLAYALNLTVFSTAAPTIIGEGLFGWLFAAYFVPAAATWRLTRERR